MGTGNDVAPWLQWPLGARVVVRRRLPDGRYSDVLGELVRRGPDGVDVLRTDGTEHVPAEEIAIGKVVPPPPRDRRSFRPRR
jgi:hypothetical protein